MRNKKHKNTFSKRNPGMRSNIGDPMPHQSANQAGNISEAAKFRDARSAEAFVKESRSQQSGSR